MLSRFKSVQFKAAVVAAIAGDMEAARNVELVLPETGVCSTDLTDDPEPNGLPVLAGVGSGTSVCCR